MKIFEVLCDFDSSWLKASFIMIFVCLISWKLMMNEFQRATDALGRGLLIAIYLILVGVDKCMFYQTVKTQPKFDFGFYGSVLIPTVLFYVSLIAIALFFLRSLKYGFLSSMSLLQFIPGGYAIAVAEFAWAMAHGCPVGMFLGFISFVTVAWKGLAIPTDAPKEKTE